LIWWISVWYGAREEGGVLELLRAAPVWRADGSDTAAKAAAETLWGATP